MTIKYFRTDSADMLLSALYIKPSLFDTPEMQNLNENDFPDTLRKVSYSIMFNLFSLGHTRMTGNIIEAYLQGRPQLSEFFYQKDNENSVPLGTKYFEKLALVGDETNFKPAYDMTKKMTLLRTLYRYGVDITKYYDWDATDSALVEAQRTWLERHSANDIVQIVQEDIAKIMVSSISQERSESAQAGQDIFDLIQELKETPDYGLPSAIDMQDTIVRGKRLGKFYLFSAPTGNGKSRLMMADACQSAISKKFNPHTREWEETGFEPQGSLFISTELDLKECQTMALAYITGIPENIILDGKYNPDDEAIILEGAKVLQESKLYFEIISDFSIQEIESTIRLYYREKKVDYFFFDYIHVSMKLLAEISSIANGTRVREDQILFMLSTRLKELANTLGIFIQSATQVNGDYLEGELNQNALRGSKAVADRLDVGIIGTKIRPIDEELVDRFVSSGFQRPNYVLSFYKIRRGKYAGTKLWCDVDLGTCRGRGLFLTDSLNNPIAIDKKTIKVVKSAEKNLDKRDLNYGKQSAF